MNDTFIVDKADIIFKKLKWICPKFKKYSWVELLVLIFTFLSILVFILSSLIANLDICFKIIYLIIPLFLVSNTVIYQINVLLFDYRRKTKNNETYMIKGYTRLLILLGLNYFTLLFSFATIYHVSQYNFSINTQLSNISHVNTLDGAFYYSVETMATLGHGDIIPITWIGRLLTSIHLLIGLFMNLILIGRFVSLIPKPWTKDEIEKEYLKRIFQEENKLKQGLQPQSPTEK